MHKKTKTSFVKKLYLWISRAVELQLVLTSVSLPLVVSWGLPVSLVSIIGNIIFAPFLFCFLFLSSLVFTSQLLSVPNGAVIMLLDWLQVLWMKLIACASQNVLIELPAPSLGIAACMVSASLVLLCICMTRSQRCFLFLGLLVLNCFFMQHAVPSEQALTFSDGSKKLSFIKIQDTLVCVDHGIRARGSLASWLTYTVIPALRKTFGSTKIKTFVLLKPTAQSDMVIDLVLQSTSSCSSCLCVLPACAGYVPRRTLEALGRLERFIHEHHHRIVEVHERSLPLAVVSEGFLEVVSPGTMQQTKRFSHPALYVVGIVARKSQCFLPIMGRREHVVFN